MSIKSDIDKFCSYFDQELKNSLSLIDQVPEKLYDAVDYILFSGGKRIRPYLMFESSKVFKYSEEKLINYALALEMIHTYSLVHDDLPAMDNDDYRRGKPTVHKLYGEDIAILVGDTLLNLAYELIAKSLISSSSIEDYSKGTEAFINLSKASGARGMIGGQVLDMEIENDNETVELIDMYSLKTGALFKTSSSMGAILGGGDQSEIEKMGDFGLYLGLAYQIQDDILDYDEDREIDKATIATRYGVDRAREISEEYTEKALSILDDLGKDRTQNLKELTYLLLDRSY